MENHSFITLPLADGSEMDAYIALPENKGPFPAIILLQEAFGVNHHIRNVAKRLNKEGYAVIAPDLFHRTASRIEIDYKDFAAARPHMQAISNEGLEADLKACYTWLQHQETIDSSRIGSIGFCLG